MKKVAVVTTTRADYGILRPLIRKINNDSRFELSLIVSGGHLSVEQGYTINEIKNDEIPLSHLIEILHVGDSPYDISLTMANAISRFAAVFRDDRPDIVVLLGDRTEMLAIASAALNERIPIAHIGGGEVTEGAVDDSIRHSITKMSYLHFVGTEQYRNRVIQLGESPDRVFNVGYLSTENILKESLLDEKEIRSILNIPINCKYAVVTFHPVTLENNSAGYQANELCKAMTEQSDLYYIITKANTDTGGMEVNRKFEEYAKQHNNIRLVSSLGMLRYLSAVKYASFVLGNSSSGISEAPVLGTPTVNIGNRQKGRTMAESIISCHTSKESIINAIMIAKKAEHVPTKLFGQGDTSEKIIHIIHHFLDSNCIDLKKGFYDYPLQKLDVRGET